MFVMVNIMTSSAKYSCVYVLICLLGSAMADSWRPGGVDPYSDSQFGHFWKISNGNRENIDHLLKESINVLNICKKSFNVAIDILESSDRIPHLISGISKINFTEILNSDDFESNWVAEEFTFDNIGINEFIMQLLVSIKDTCQMLPSMMSVPKGNNIQHTVESLIKWTRYAIFQLETYMAHLLDSYANHPDLSSFLFTLKEISNELKNNEDFSDLLMFTNDLLDDIEVNKLSKTRVARLEQIMKILSKPMTKQPDYTAKMNKDPYHRDYEFGELEIDTSIIVSELPVEFLSVAIGSKLIQKKFNNILSKRERFVNLASWLSPAILRVGGTASNFLTYDPTREQNEIHSPYKGWASLDDFEDSFQHPKAYSMKDRCEKQLTRDFTNFTMTGVEWDYLTELAQDLQWPILFDLNQMKRNSDGSWDSSNAELLFKDPATEKVPIIWQLGNEPNSYGHVFGWRLTPSQAAEDYEKLRKILESNLSPVGPYFLVGPDVTRPRKFGDTTYEELHTDASKFLSEFLQKANQFVDAVTWHQYYVNGREATVDDFLSVDLMNRFPNQLAVIADIKDQYAKNKPIWLTETANAWGGGAPQLSEGFAGTFLWLDKLGSAPLGGVSMIFRQTLIGGCYGLLDKHMNPTPMYWVSVLHKQLVGQKVLLPRVRMASPNIRIYAHCLQPNHYLYRSGAIVVFGMNVGNEPQSLSYVNDELKKTDKFQYRLTAPLNDLTSSIILLNGEPLEALPSGIIPPFTANLINEEEMIFSAKSIQFLVFPYANNTMCLHV